MAVPKGVDPAVEVVHAYTQAGGQIVKAAGKWYHYHDRDSNMRKLINVGEAVALLYESNTTGRLDRARWIPNAGDGALVFDRKVKNHPRFREIQETVGTPVPTPLLGLLLARGKDETVDVSVVPPKSVVDDLDEALELLDAAAYSEPDSKWLKDDRIGWNRRRRKLIKKYFDGDPEPSLSETS